MDAWVRIRDYFTKKHSVLLLYHCNIHSTMHILKELMKTLCFFRKMYSF
jgi:hypothetical protein